MNNNGKVEPYSPRVREYLDAEVRRMKLQPDDPECGLVEDRLEDLWYSMTAVERDQLRKVEVNGV